MLHVLLILTMGAVLLSERGLVLSPGLDDGWMLALGFGPAVLGWLWLEWVCRGAARRMDAGGGEGAAGAGRAMRAVVRAERMVELHRGLVVGWHWVMVFGLGWVEWWRERIGDVVLADEALAVSPVLAAIFLGWAARFRIERRMHDAMVVRWLDEGRTVHPALSLGEYLLLNARNQLAIVLAPVMMLLVWGEVVSAALVRWAKYGAGAGGTRGGWVGDVGRWLAADDHLAAMQGLGQLAGIAVVVVVTPLVLRRVWDTAPMPSGQMSEKLLEMCRLAGIRVRRLLVWRTRNSLVNGAVLGVTARSRYILLTDALLETLPWQQVEAVMAHEIAHVAKRHVAWLLGAMIASCGLVAIAGDLALRGAASAAEAMGAASWAVAGGRGLGEMGLSVAALVVGLACFGWVSRRFEWQADAFAAATLSRRLNTPEEGARSGEAGGVAALGGVVTEAGAWTMAAALESVAAHNHIRRERFSWRHGSISTRVDRLRGLVGVPLAGMPIDVVAGRIKLATAIGLLLVGAAVVWDIVGA